MPPAGKPPRVSVAQSLGISDAGGDAGEFFAKQNKKLMEENEKLRSRLESMQGDLDTLESFKIKHEAESERRATEDKFTGSSAAVRASKARQSTAGGKASRPSSASLGANKLGSIGEAEQTAAAPPVPAASRRSSLDKLTGGLMSSRAGKSVGASAKAAAPEMAADARKMLDDFKKPLDDTKSLINEFANGRGVPTVLAIHHAVSMRMALDSLGAQSESLEAQVAALDHRFGDASKQSREQRLGAVPVAI